jgi:hypothetical protein
VSRLDSAIRRLEAQRACLDRAVELARGVAGPALEIGLGNGRTYDHLRQRLGDRPIYVFERQLAAHPGSLPPAGHLILGDVLETLPRFFRDGAAPAALAHADIGSGDAAPTAALAAALAPRLATAMAAGGIVACDQPLALPDRLAPLPLPDGVAPGRYFLYRATA